jgi:hypothetical protein
MKLVTGRCPQFFCHCQNIELTGLFFRQPRKKNRTEKQNKTIKSSNPGQARLSRLFLSSDISLPLFSSFTRSLNMVEMSSDEAILQQMGYKQASICFYQLTVCYLAVNAILRGNRNYDEHGHHFETFAYAFLP